MPATVGSLLSSVCGVSETVSAETSFQAPASGSETSVLTRAAFNVVSSCAAIAVKDGSASSPTNITIIAANRRTKDIRFMSQPRKVLRHENRILNVAEECAISVRINVSIVSKSAGRRSLDIHLRYNSQRGLPRFSYDERSQSAVTDNSLPPDRPAACHHRMGFAARLIIDLSLIHISEPTRRTPISYAVF